MSSVGERDHWLTLVEGRRCGVEGEALMGFVSGPNLLVNNRGEFAGRCPRVTADSPLSRCIITFGLPGGVSGQIVSVGASRISIFETVYFYH